MYLTQIASEKIGRTAANVGTERAELKEVLSVDFW